ncbi:hypothetical protein Sste5344_009274 [Sporothrix stenoceras]
MPSTPVNSAGPGPTTDIAASSAPGMGAPSAYREASTPSTPSHSNRSSADTIKVASASSSTAGPTTSTATSTNASACTSSNSSISGRRDGVVAEALPQPPIDEDDGMTDAPPVYDTAQSEAHDRRPDVDSRPAVTALSPPSTSAPGLSILSAIATATPQQPPQQNTSAPQNTTSTSAPLHQNTPHSIGTPSTTYSLQLSPSQVRSNPHHAPSVSSGRVSVSQDLFGGASAGSVFSIVPNINIESATAQWLGLLIGDATQDAGGGLPAFEWDCEEAGGLDVFGNSVAAPDITVPEDVPSVSNSTGNKSNPGLQERFSRLVGEQQQLEMQAWHTAIPIELLPHEYALFQHFVLSISCTMDLFDPKKSFGTFVPHLAMHNVGLINAILALSARHLSLKAKAKGHTGDDNALGLANAPSENEAIRYYYKTLHYIQKAMEYDTYKTSLELLATSIIVSTYEMLDGSRRDWERHLQGVFLIQRSQVIHGDSGGLRAAVWWSWLCQDVWAAFRERRKPLTFWQPTRRLDELDPYELAARSVFYFAHVVAFCSSEEMEKHRASPAARMAKADALLESLADWRLHHTVEFEQLPTLSTPEESEAPFTPIWIHPPAFGVAVQLYYCSLILITLNRPLVGDLDAYLQQRKSIQRYVAVVCGIAMTTTTLTSEDASSVMCSQCLYIAGLSIEDPKRQRAVLELLERCRQRAVWPATPLSDELARKWQESA